MSSSESARPRTPVLASTAPPLSTGELHVKVRCAAVAGWWTLLVAAGFALLLWLGFLAFVKPRPAWVLELWGSDLTWAALESMWMWIYSVYRLIVWTLLLLVAWLTLWARQLRRASR